MGCKGSQVQILPSRPIRKIMQNRQSRLMRLFLFYSGRRLLWQAAAGRRGSTMTDSKPDDLYAQQRAVIERFSFDDQVVRVFPDMIRRSVPGYSTIIEMTGVLASRYAQPHTRLYHLVCLLGASSLAMAQLVNQPGCEIISIDNSAAMIDQARQLIAQSSVQTPITLQHADVLDVPWQPASVVVMNFTLQFIAADQRDALVRRIADAL